MSMSMTSTVANDVESITDHGGSHRRKCDGRNHSTPRRRRCHVDGHQVALAEGPNTVMIVVTSGDDSQTQTYTVTINRASAVPVEGAMLLTLSLSNA